MWLNYVEPTPEAVTETTDETVVETGIIKVKVTEITDAITFYIQTVDDPNATKVIELMKTFSADPPAAPEDFSFEKGLVCAGQFDDDQFHRVRIEGKQGDDEYRVSFVDFGNADVIAKSALRPLPEAISSLPSCARACVLAGIRAPSSASEYSHLSTMAFSDLVWDRELLAKIETKDKNGKLHLTLFPEADSVSINCTLVQESFVRVVERPLRNIAPLMAELQEAQEQAIRSRVAGRIWEYGDVSDDEEEEEGARRRDDGRVPRRQ
jgi:staphylococcal nuclease domain-containing protein 1